MATKKASKTAVKKAPAKKATKKAAVKKSPAKKTVVKKSAAKKSAAKKAPAKKAAKKSASKKTSAKKSTRKYGPGASKSVEREMKAMERGKLKSGSGQKVTSRKQAIAIGLSEARKKGDKVPAQK